MSSKFQITDSLILGTIWICLILLVKSSNADNEEEQPQNLEYGADRESRLLGIPGFIPFGEFYNPSGKTCTISATNEIGACYSKTACRKLGGSVSDTTCGSGFKGQICCLFNATCTNVTQTVTVRRDNSYIRYVPGNTCQTKYRFPRVEKNICQLKLEFKEFKLGKPSMSGFSTGNCDRDIMSIRSAANAQSNLNLCGVYEGNADPDTEHLYLHYGDSNEITVSLAVLNETQNSRVKILVKQIKCDDPNRAPQDCTQYFTKSQANIKSFNFEEQKGQGQQLNNLNYAVCIKSESQDNVLRWTTCSGDAFNDFDITHPTDSVGCTKDSITIPGSELGKYCKQTQLIGEIRSSAKPYIMYVDFDNVEIDENCPTMLCPGEEPGGTLCCDPGSEGDGPGNRGFCLHYMKV